MKRENLDTLKHFLTIKSISTQDEFLPEMEKARHFLVDLFRNLGFTTKILKAKKHDAIFAQKITDPKLPTVLVYGHYDVQPPEPLEEWKSNPFEPTIKNDKIYARGTTDDKGQLLIHLMAAKTLSADNKKLPINLKFIIEGEEEIGSISVESIVRQNKKLLQCDYLIVSDSEMLAPNQPAIDVSLRGLVYAEIIIETAKHDLHSGLFGGVVENPAIVLSRLITQLKDLNHRITIPKFYDRVISPTKKEVKDYQKIKVLPEQLTKEAESYGIGGGEEWYSLNQRRWARPTLDINGLNSGYQGEGSKTIIPAKASAKISLRLVPNQNPKEIYKNLVSYVKKLLPKNVKLTILHHADALPYKVLIEHPVFDIVGQSLKKVFGKEPIFTGVGGSIGFIPITAHALKVPCIIIGFGLPTDNLHAPNEHFSLENYDKGIKVMVDFYQKLPTLD